MNSLDYFRGWVQKTLPAVYDDSLSYYELLTKVMQTLNTTIQGINDLITQEQAHYNDLNYRKEDSANITNNRKLSPTGDFTGTLNGQPIALTDQGMATDWQASKGSFNTVADRMNYFDSELYTKPLLVLSSNQVNYTLKHAQSVLSTILNLIITKKSKDIVRIDYKRNGTLIHSNTSPNDFSDSYIDGSVINNDTNYQVLVNDGISDTLSNILNFYFVYPFWVGQINNTINVIDETVIKNLTETIKTKQNITTPFTLNNEKVVFAYPSNYGNLTSIIDRNGFNITTSFTKTVVSVTQDDNTIQSYNVYAMNDYATVSSFNITFNF